MTQEQWASLEPGQIITDNFSGGKWKVISKEPTAGRRIHYKVRRISPQFRVVGEPIAYELFKEEDEATDAT